jgi:hypothetical protein
MRDALVTLLNRGEYCPIPSVIADASARVINCAVMGAYDLRQLIEDVMRASPDDEMEWESCRTNSDALCFALSKIITTEIGRSIALDVRFENWSCDVIGEQDDPHLNFSQKIISIPLPCASVSHLNRVPEYKAQFILSVFESLRRIWHVNVGAPASNCWALSDLLMWNKCLRADLDIMNIVMAYQLRGLGFVDIWRSVLASSLRDLADSYCDSMAISFDEDYGDEHLDILADLYLSWFYNDDRVNECDHATLSSIDHQLKQTSVDMIIGTNRLTAHDIMGLSLYPLGGMPYLDVVASELIYNPEYTDMRCDMLRAHKIQLEQEINDSQSVPSNLLIFRDPSLNRLFSNGTYIDTVS